MHTQVIKDGLFWGTILWFIGYALGFLFFFIVPPSMIGWLITPIGIALTVWVLLRRIKGDSLPYYISLGAIWTTIAIVLDYFLLVQLLHPADGYYKADVYLYYLLTFTLPLAAYWFKSRNA